MNRQVVLGVGGGIAAYKACELLRRLTESGHSVRVIPTQSALQFVGKATFEALSGQPVSTSVWENVPAVPHVFLGQNADLVIVAPATADLLARAAAGRADDLLTSTLLTATCPIIFAPAMHTEMWQHPATQANVALLRSRGAIVINPDSGRLTGKDTGSGRLPAPESLMGVCRAVLDRTSAGADLTGLRVVITAGGTREPLDPVRFLGNRSSGKQGWALASAAAARGASVKVIATNVQAETPAGSEIERVTTAAELRDATLAAAKDADVVVMAAAVADFRPTLFADSKIKKADDPDVVPSPLQLQRTVDILCELGQRRSAHGALLVGFAAETVATTDELIALAERKLAAKGADLIVGNQVGSGKGFGVGENSAVIVDQTGLVRSVELMSKEGLANIIWDVVVAQLRQST